MSKFCIKTTGYGTEPAENLCQPDRFYQKNYQFR